VQSLRQKGKPEEAALKDYNEFLIIDYMVFVNREKQY